MEDMTNLFNSLNNVLSNTDLTDVTADSNNFQDLPDGYYLAEVEKAELKESKSTHQPMVAFQFKTVDDGLGISNDGSYIKLTKTKNRKVFIYYVLKDESFVKRFATDMLKFEGEEKGKPILDKEYFTTAEVLVDALDILIGHRVYIQSSTTENDDGSTSNWKNLISWKRAEALELPL